MRPPPPAHSPQCCPSTRGMNGNLEAKGTCQCCGEHNDGEPPLNQVCLKWSRSSILAIAEHTGAEHSGTTCAGAHQVKDKTLNRSGCCQLAGWRASARTVISPSRRFTLELKPSACEPRSSWAAPGPSAGSRKLLWRRSCSTLTGLPTLSSRSPASRCFSLLADKSGSSPAHQRRERDGTPCVGSKAAATPASR